MIKEFKLSKVFIHAIFIFFAILCVIPLVAIVSVSLTDEVDIVKNGYMLIPPKLDIKSYLFVLTNPKMIVNAYSVSIFLSIAGTLLSLILTAGISYALSRVDFKFRKAISFYIFFTMLFSGGLVPWYMLISKYLHLKDTIWVLILPMLITPWFVLILRTFMQAIPMEIIESCTVDGANEFQIFFKMILPLSKPGLATVALFILLRYWNDWWHAMLFIEKETLVPLQYMLSRMMQNIQYLTNSSNALPAGMMVERLPNESARMAMAVLAAGPMLVVFPFFQKYFVKGLTIGAVKG